MFKWLIYTLLLGGALCLLNSCDSSESSNINSSKSQQQIEEVDTLISKALVLNRNEDSLRVGVEILEKALLISKKANYVEGIIKSSNRLGSSYNALSNLVKSSGHFHSALKNAELYKDTQGVSQALFGLGLIMYNMNNWPEARQYFNRAQSMIKQNSKTVFFRSNVNYLLGLCSFQMGDSIDAKKYYYESSRLAKEIGLVHREREVRLSLNNTKSEFDDVDSTLAEYEVLIKEFKQVKQKIGMCFALEGKARYYLKLGKAQEATKNANESLNLAKQLNILYPLQSILTVVTEAEFKNGNYKAASAHMRDLQNLRDSLQDLTSATKVTMMGAEYEFDKEKAALDNTIKSQNRQRLIWLVIAAVLFSVLLLIFYLLKNVSKERKKSDTLLLNILPEETAKELKKYGKAQAKFHKEISIVFADIKGFTQFAEGLKPSVLVKMLDTYFRMFDKVIGDYHLEKIKTIGDAYMFVSGFHRHENSVTDAVNASLEMLKQLDQIKPKMEAKYGLSFDFRFGMHTGNVVSGVVGEKKYAFDVWGDAVNIAARMEENSMPGKLNISQDTYKLLKGQFKCTPRGEILAKNKGKIPMYFIQSL